jgi:hypothetical protein
MIEFMAELIGEDRNAFSVLLFFLLIALAIGVASLIVVSLSDGWNHFKAKREVEKVCRDAVIQAKIERIKQEAEDAAPKPWIY